MGRNTNKINKAAFAQRLNQTLDKEGFPPLYRGRIQLLADLFNLSHRGVGKWVNGETCPPLRKYPIIAAKLNVSTEWLQTGRGEMTRPESKTHAIYVKQEVPLLKATDLDNPQAISNQTITCYVNTIGKTYAVKIDSEAMSPRFPPGTLIIVDTGRIAKDGDFVLVESGAFPSLVFRQFFISNETSYLNAQNPKFDRIMLSPKDKIKGVVVQAVMLFL